MKAKRFLSVILPLGLLGIAISAETSCSSPDSETSGPTAIPELAPPALVDEPMVGSNGGSHPDAARVDEDGNVISTPAPEPEEPSEAEPPPEVPATEDGHVADLPPEPK